MERFVNLSDCTGCGACSQACTHDAVAMVADKSGYIYPEFDSTLCVDCGLCAKACPVLAPVGLHDPHDAFAVHAADASDRRASSSGGAASMLAASMIEVGGIVYACVQDDYRNIYHRRLTDKASISGIKGSKYVQSDLRDTFTECRRDLNDGLKVLFIGTPCQIAGLRTYLHKDYDNLYTVDLVCHGVPSQQLLRDDIALLKAKARIGDDACVGFRKKDAKGTRFGIYVSEHGKVICQRDYPNDYFISGFLKGLFFRENCFACQYARPQRVSDLTIGDFWGLGKDAPTSMDLKRGVSLVLVNTQKGDALMDGISSMAVAERRTVAEAVAGNAQLRHCFRRSDDYDAFHSSYANDGYRHSCSKYLDEYIRRNRIVMMNERHPILMLPYRILSKILRR